MKTQKGSEGDNSKLVLSSRVKPHLKKKILADARSRGITASELIESTLTNLDFLNADGKELALSVVERDEPITREQSELELSVAQLQSDNLRLSNHNQELLKYVGQMNYFLEIYNRPRLLEFFNKLNGMTDEIKLEDGSMVIVKYNNLRDVLDGILNSVKL